MDLDVNIIYTKVLQTTIIEYQDDVQKLQIKKKSSLFKHQAKLFRKKWLKKKKHPCLGIRLAGLLSHPIHLKTAPDAEHHSEPLRPLESEHVCVWERVHVCVSVCASSSVIRNRVT